MLARSQGGKGLFDLVLAAVLAVGEELQSNAEALGGLGVGGDGGIEGLAAIGEVVSLGGCLVIDVHLAVRAERVDGQQRPQTGRQHARRVVVRELWLGRLGHALAGLLGGVVRAGGQLVEDGVRDGGRVAALLAGCEGLFRGDEAGVF